MNDRAARNNHELAASDDPVASKVSWVPINRACANFTTQRMIRAGDKIVIRNTKGLMVFSGLFIAIGLFAAVKALMALFYGNFSFAIFLGLFAVAFNFGGISSLRSYKGFVLDLGKGYYFFGARYQPDLTLPRGQQGLVAQVHAIQLLEKNLV